MTKNSNKSKTKQAIIISLLYRENGVSLDELMQATNWQSHSICGHLSNLKSKKNIKVNSKTNESGKKVYFIQSESQSAIDAGW